MRTALLTATALVALSSLAVAQNQIDATTEAAPKAKPINPNTVDDPELLPIIGPPCWPFSSKLRSGRAELPLTD
jgi:hypothetical protein